MLCRLCSLEHVERSPSDRSPLRGLLSHSRPLAETAGDRTYGALLLAIIRQAATITPLMRVAPLLYPHRLQAPTAYVLSYRKPRSGLGIPIEMVWLQNLFCSKKAVNIFFKQGDNVIFQISAQKSR